MQIYNEDVKMNWKHLIGWLIDYGSKVLDKKYGMTIKSEFVFSFGNVSRILMILTKCYIFESDTDNTNKDLCKTIRVDEVKFGLYRKSVSDLCSLLWGKS